MPDENVVEPWKRKPEEPLLWYSRFHRFMLLGSRRSLLSAVNQELVEKGRIKQNKVPGAWNNAAQEWKWRDRAAAWDASQQQRDEEEWQIRRREQRELEWQVSQQLLKKAEQMLSRSLDDCKWSFRDAATCFEVASKLARLAAEMHRGDLNAAIAFVRKYGYAVSDTYHRLDEEAE